jgi:hypothetical protein
MGKNMIFSSDLLKKPIELGQPGCDKVFVAVSSIACPSGGPWMVNIESNALAVVLNQRVNEELNVCCPVVNDVRAGKVVGSALFSGGSFIWIKEREIRKLFLFKRDDDAPTDAGLMTGPAGRCAEILSSTIMEETNEEIIIVKASDGSDDYKLLGFYRNEADKEKIIQIKSFQLVAKINGLLAKGKTCDVDILKSIRIPEDIVFLPIEACKNQDIKTETVITTVDGEEVDRVENCIVFFDQVNHTLEVRRILEVVIPEGERLITVIDGENFGPNSGREVTCFNSLEEVPRDKAVPTLDYYLRQSVKS